MKRKWTLYVKHILQQGCRVPHEHPTIVMHSVQVDVYGTGDARRKNEKIEFDRNRERFQFLRLGQNAFKNFNIVPPGSGIVHQVNLGYLACVVDNFGSMPCPDSVVGTNSHTTMINGLGVLGWGVGGIEAETVMLGQPISMTLPEVVGFKLTDQLDKTATATDLVLTIVQILSKRAVVGKFLEFLCDGLGKLTIADRTTIGIMTPEYSATCGFFAVDGQTVDFMRLTGRNSYHIDTTEEYIRSQNVFRDYNAKKEPKYREEITHLDLSSIEPCLSGPKRPHDRVTLSAMKSTFNHALTNKVGFQGFGLSTEKATKSAKLTYKGENYELKHGTFVISAITACTNTSNSDVMLAVGLVARNVIKKELKVKP